MGLKEEIREKSKTILTDAYQMSIGELINLYRDEELDIHPEFQRLFRWSEAQRVRLIESILLGIPLPSIFVGQRDDGVWDVVDGVQRLSTIFQFVGVLKDENGSKVSPLILHATKYLPSLEGVRWEDEEDGHQLPTDLKMNFKRSRIDVSIVKNASDPSSKYELFQRLNTGGTSLSEQEVRNCLMIMTNGDLYRRIDCLPLSEAKENNQYRLEMVTRLLAAEFSPGPEDGIIDLAPYLDEKAIKMCSMTESFNEMEDKFKQTFDLIDGAVGEDAFRKYDRDKQKYVGPFLVGLYQAVSYGVLHNLAFIQSLPYSERFIEETINKLRESERYTDLSRHGVRPLPRFLELNNLGAEFFYHEY